MSGTHPDHIADADKKVQPARCPHCGYTPGVIPSDFDAYAQANCEHRGSHGQPAPAPLPSYTFDSHTHALKFIAASLTDLGGEQEALDTVCAHISDLTRRLAEAEAELAARTRLASNAQDALRHARAEILSRFTHMEFADRQADANIWVYDLEALCSGLEYQLIRAAAAEARVRELEAEIDSKDRECVEAIFADAELDPDDIADTVREFWEKRERALVKENISFRTECINLETQRADLEAFKARVMEWARGEQCGVCENNVHPHEKCFDCSGNGGETGSANNWTPPQAWEVGE